MVESINRLKRYRGYKNVTPKSFCDLEIRSKSPKRDQLKLVPIIYLGKFGGIPSTGSKDILGTRICHTNANADANADTHQYVQTFDVGGYN